MNNSELAETIFFRVQQLLLTCIPLYSNFMPSDGVKINSFQQG